MKCKCGCDQFYASQCVYIDIIVDEHGNFLENRYSTAEESIFEADDPYGPYYCTECGAEYDQLEV